MSQHLRLKHDRVGLENLRVLSFTVHFFFFFEEELLVPPAAVQILV